MASRSTRPAWEIPADEFGKSLRGLGLNLLVTDIKASLAFAEEVLGAKTVYWNEDFAVLARGDAQWMLHADHTYQDNPLSGFLTGVSGRGQGAEFQLYQTDPDEAEAIARKRGDTVLAGALNKPHGLREVYILDPDGYCWVLSRPLRDGED